MYLAVLLEELTGGGVERTTLKLVGGLLRRGHKVDLVLLRPGGRLEPELPAGAGVVMLQPNGLRAGRWAAVRADPGGLPLMTKTVLLAQPRYLPSSLLHLSSLADFLRRARPDILLSAKHWPNLCAVWARDLAGVPTRVVLSVRTSLVEHKNSLRCEDRRAQMHRYFPRADAIVTVSHDLASELADFAAIDRGRITVIYNAVVDEALGAAAAEAPDHPWLEHGGPPVILGVGRLAAQKGFETLVRAFARVRGERASRLIILGEGKTADLSRDAARRIMGLAAELGVAEDVSLPGFKHNPFAYMTRAAAFVLSSHYEGLPAVLIQAMACGCPVVSTDCPTGPREILEDGRYGPLVPVDDDLAMAGAISGVLDAPLGASVLRERAQEFSLAAATDAYLDLFHGLAIPASRTLAEPAVSLSVQGQTHEISRPAGLRRPAIMRVRTFLRSAGEGANGTRKREVLCRFHEGMVLEGVYAGLVDGMAYEPCDVAVIFGGRPSAQHEPTQAVRRDIQENHSGTFINIETPFLGRRVFQRSRLAAWMYKKVKIVSHHRFSDDYSYYRIGIDGFLADDADFNNRSSPPDRWREMSRTLGLKLKPYRRHGRSIMVIGQVPGDLSLRGLDIVDWMYETALAAQQHSDRPIIVRPHPVTVPHMLKEIRRRFDGLAGITLDYPPRRPICDVLKDCWVLIAYSSGATIDALIEGVPCVAFSPANPAWPVSDHSLERIEHPTLFEREQWLCDLAYAQWSPGEMQAGLAWRHLRRAVLTRTERVLACSTGRECAEVSAAVYANAVSSPDW
jgi:glycosyltransferase involved in cell wall biosynthesis